MACGLQRTGVALLAECDEMHNDSQRYSSQREPKQREQTQVSRQT
jgi:hypothetical protein